MILSTSTMPYFPTNSQMWLYWLSAHAQKVLSDGSKTVSESTSSIVWVRKWSNDMGSHGSTVILTSKYKKCINMLYCIVWDRVSVVPFAVRSKMTSDGMLTLRQKRQVRLPPAIAGESSEMPLESTFIKRLDTNGQWWQKSELLLWSW